MVLNHLHVYIIICKYIHNYVHTVSQRSISEPILPKPDSSDNYCLHKIVVCMAMCTARSWLKFHV